MKFVYLFVRFLYTVYLHGTKIYCYGIIIDDDRLMNLIILLCVNNSQVKLVKVVLVMGLWEINFPLARLRNHD